MRLLVTGGAGFIGSNFVRYWTQHYHDDKVTVLDKLTYAGNLENLKDIKVNFIKGDICDKILVDSLMKDTDTVIHFAAESHVDRSIGDASPFLQTNVYGTYVLLQSAIEYKIKHFHHVSTDEVFGSLELDSQDAFNEKTAYDPKSPYAASKASSDHLVRSYAHTYGLKYTISNCSNNFGPYQYPEKFIPLVITNLLKNKKVPVYGDGLNIRDWLYVDDHVRAIEAILLNGGGTYCVGGLTNNVSNIELVRKILKLMKRDESWIEYVSDRKGHDKRYTVDWRKINDDLLWKPVWGLDEGLKATIEWYTKNRSWWEKSNESN